MKQLLSLFLLLLPCFALAQYPSNGNQKITLGEQSTADGLVYRGVAATDTVRKPSIDTMAYMVLDTTTNIMWHYKKATSNAWLRLNLLPSDTASMLTNYYRSGRALGTPSSGVLSAATGLPLTTGVTGTLGGANGGTGITTFGAANRIPYAASTTALTTDADFVYNTTTKSFGVGTSNPTRRLHLVNDLNNSVVVTFQNNVTRASGFSSYAFELFSEGRTGSSYAFRAKNLNESKVYFTIQTDSLNSVGGDRTGFVGIGTDAPTEVLHVVGNARFTGVTAGTFSNNLNITSTGVLTTATSDAKYKYNIRPLNYGLETLLQLNPVNFQWIEGEEEDLGFIAQDVAEIIPEAVNTNWNSDLLFRYESLIPILTKAIQEQQALIKALEQRIFNLENK